MKFLKENLWIWIFAIIAITLIGMYDIVDGATVERNPRQTTAPAQEVHRIRIDRLDISDEAGEELSLYQNKDGWFISIPEEIIESADKYGREYDIAPEILEAVAYVESTFRCDAYDGTCIGTMQINVDAQKKRIEKLQITDLTDPDQSIHIAADYLAELLRKNEDICYALDIYNGNSAAGQQYEEGIISGYARKVTTLSAALERAHGK